jgi:hypothetical protein
MGQPDGTPPANRASNRLSMLLARGWHALEAVQVTLFWAYPS